MQNDNSWFLGIDLGTGSCKAALIDQQGKLIGFGVGSYPQPDENHAWMEQNPEAIIQGMVAAVQTATQDADIDPQKCSAVSLGCALHGLLAVNENKQPLTGVYTWADNRAFPQAEKIKQSSLAHTLYQQTGCPPHGMYPLYKILWLQENHPEIFNHTARFISVKEYILEKLTGEYLVDYSLASGTGLLNIHTLTWNQPSLDLAHISSDKLSTLGSPADVHQAIASPLLTQLGILPGTPIALGSSDAANSNIGAGAVRPTQATCMVGTSGAYRIIAQQPLLSENASTWCYCIDDQHWLVGGAINNGGIAFSWLRDTLNHHLPDSVENNFSFDDLVSLAAQSPIGGNGLLCLPLFAGERSPNWNLNARAAFFGISLNHDLRHLSRALLEGIAFRLRTLDEILTNLSSDIQEVRASGGFTRSVFWSQLICDILNRPLSIPTEGETSSLGAAYWAFIASQPNATLETIQDFNPVAQTYQPQQENKADYDHLYGLSKQFYAALRPLFGPISELQRDEND